MTVTELILETLPPEIVQKITKIVREEVGYRVRTIS